MLSAVVKEDEGRTGSMIRKRFTAEQILHTLREVEVDLSSGLVTTYLPVGTPEANRPNFAEG